METQPSHLNKSVIDTTLEQIFESPFVQFADIYGLFDFLTPIRENRYQVLVVKDDVEAQSLSYRGENKRVVVLDEPREILKHPGCEIHMSRGATGILLYQGRSAISVLTAHIYRMMDSFREDRNDIISTYREREKKSEETILSLRGDIMRLQLEITALELQAQEDEKALAAAQLSSGGKAAQKRTKMLVERNRSLEKRLIILETENEALRADASKSQNV